MKALVDYDYPGNVRELGNIMQRAVTFSNKKKLETESLPKRLFKSNKLKSQISGGDDKSSKDFFKLNTDRILTLEELEKLYIEFALKHCSNNKRRVATLLGIGRRTLYRRLGQAESAEE